MDCNLIGLKTSPHWRKNLNGFFVFDDGRECTDQEVRYIVELGIKRGYRTIKEIPEDEIKKWIGE